jgi:cellulose synthase/poly-beta-1,6-N-acetylglucosamine synthase-like glycosyltransferase
MKRIGELLQAEGIITAHQLAWGLEQQQKNAKKLGQIFLEYQLIIPEDLDRVLAQQFGLEYRPSLETPQHSPDLQTQKVPRNQFALSESMAQFCLHHLATPLTENLWALCDIDQEKMMAVKKQLGPHIKLVVSSKQQVMLRVHHLFRDTFQDYALASLAKSYPHFSASRVFTPIQKVIGLILCMTLVWGLTFHPWQTVYHVHLGALLFLTAHFFFKIYLVWKARKTLSLASPSLQDAQFNDDLPVYSILVPLFQEERMIPHLIKDLSTLHYPQHKLDIKFVLEENDLMTIEACQKMQLPSFIETVIVPHSLPKTKPKACNYALQFVRGAYTVIYDAEDRPEPDQLLKALEAFKKYDTPKGEMAVAQAHLNFYNPQENSLTRFFTLEYSVWFDYFLPGLHQANMPIPLGGTSNHFKTDVLRAVGGWDPFNVTEDADLGLRLAQCGWKVRTFPSTTYEEANTKWGNWIRQRSRWVKGYMQTYLVHMRRPLHVLTHQGFRFFICLQLFVGGTFLTALICPFLIFMFVYWCLTFTSFFDPLFDDFSWNLAWFNLVMGYVTFLSLFLFGALRRKYYSLIPWVFLTPVYWFMTSLAAYKGLWQLLFRPHYWEKTHHGLSRLFKG